MFSLIFVLSLLKGHTQFLDCSSLVSVLSVYGLVFSERGFDQGCLVAEVFSRVLEFGG